MISNRERWHYLAVQKLSVSFRGIATKHHRDFYPFNCFHFFATNKKPESHIKVFENKVFAIFVMSSEHTKILELTQYQSLIKQYLLFMEISNVKDKKLLDLKLILKIHLQKNR